MITTKPAPSKPSGSRSKLAAMTARAEAAETKLARALQENDALVAQHNEMDERIAARWGSQP